MNQTPPQPTKPQTMNREGWLHAAAERLYPKVIAAGGKRPDKFRVSCGWPSRSAMMRASSKSRRIGEAWHAGSSDGTREVFISPALENPVAVMDVLLHELIHTALPGDAGHGPAFRTIMKAVGLEGKPTATYAGDALVEELKAIGSELGHYPHAKLDQEAKPKQGTRMMKGECPDCGYTVRLTRMWIEVGMPTCPCGTTLESPEHRAEGEALTLVASSVSYTTADERFRLSTTKEGRRDGRWLVAEMFEELEDGSTVPSERWTYRASRADALAFVEAIRNGETDFPEVELDEDFDDEDEVDEDELGEVGDWDADDADLYLDEDEDEDADYEDGRIAEDEEDDYERMTDLREASGEATSQKIAAQLVGALD